MGIFARLSVFATWKAGILVKVARSLLFVSAITLLGGCAGLQPRSEIPMSEAEIARVPLGIDRLQLLQTLGPPAEEAAYKNLDETVLSWRLVLPSGQHWLFNAHLDPSGRVKYYSRTLDWPANLDGGGRM